jgi:hypothetical protein
MNEGGLTEKRAKGKSLCGEAFFCLDFLLLFDQAKNSSPRGNERPDY